MATIPSVKRGKAWRWQRRREKQRCQTAQNNSLVYVQVSQTLVQCAQKINQIIVHNNQNAEVKIIAKKRLTLTFRSAIIPASKEMKLLLIKIIRR